MVWPLMITIRAVSYNGQPTSTPINGEFGEAGGVIGRADGNALVLPDPHRHVSRMHAMIVFQNGSYVIRDISSASPVYVNGRPLGRGNEADLSDGDDLCIGAYTLKVAEEKPAPQGSGRRRSDPLVTVGARRDVTAPKNMVVSWQEADETKGGDGIRTMIVQSPHKTAARPAEAATKTPATAAAMTAEQALLHAFLAGAGVPDLDVKGPLTPEFMHMLGQILRASTQGTLDLLLARTLIKREMRAEVTTMEPRDNNNPLKFSPNVEAALAHLLAPRGTGFMPPLAAMRDAFDDLRAHQFAFMAGMRAALPPVLKRFDPGSLEKRLSEKSILDSVLPLNRKARLWGLYTEMQAALLKEAEDEFHNTFSRAFVKAYHAQLDKLAQEGKPGPP
ncbi:MAG TPA: type VI secretion system-associated FHA domain protein TagH [Pseudoduganella sp.]